MKSSDSKILHFWNLLGKLHGFLVVCLLVTVMLLVFVQVVLRYVFNAPLMGIEDYLLFPIAWLYLLGAAYASYHRAHIDCGIIMLYIKRPTTYKVLKFARSVISFAVCAWLLKWSWWYYQYLMRVDKVSSLGYIKMVYVESAAFYGILFMTIYTFVELFDWFLILIGKKEIKFVPIGGIEEDVD